MYETERLILRQWRDSDLIPFAAMGQDPLVMEYFPALLNLEESKAMINRLRSKFDKDGFTFYACELKENGEFIGFIGLNTPMFSAHFTPCVEIGWRIASRYWGMGYATEGALKCLDIGFKQFFLDEIISMAVENNYKSRNVMQKIGMRQDLSGTFLHPNFTPNHPLSKHVLYRIKKTDFKALTY